MGRKSHPWGYSMASARHDILILTMSDLCLFFYRFTVIPLPRKMPLHWSQPSDRTDLPPNSRLQDHTLCIFRKWVDHRTATFPRVFHLCTVIYEKRLVFENSTQVPCRIWLWSRSGEVHVVSPPYFTPFHFLTAELEQEVNYHWRINSIHPLSCLSPG